MPSRPPLLSLPTRQRSTSRSQVSPRIQKTKSVKTWKDISVYFDLLPYRHCVALTKYFTVYTLSEVLGTLCSSRLLNRIPRLDPLWAKSKISIWGPILDGPIYPPSSYAFWHSQWHSCYLIFLFLSNLLIWLIRWDWLCIVRSVSLLQAGFYPLDGVFSHCRKVQKSSARFRTVASFWAEES